MCFFFASLKIYSEFIMIELFPFGMWHPHGINIIPTQRERAREGERERESDSSKANQTIQLGLGLGKGSACTYVSIDA